MMRTRRAAVACCLLGLMLASACGGSDSGGSGSTRPAAEEPFSFDVPLGTQTALRLHGVSGTVAVTGAPGVALPVSVTGVRRVEADTLEDATAQLAALQVDVTSSATEVLVETVQPQFAAGRNYIVNYTIVVPEHLDVSVMTLNGDVTVRLLNGDCMIMNTNGRIQADTIVGNAILSSVNGDITASVTLPSAGQIDIGLANGTIDLGIPQATSAQFSATVGIGSITLTNLTLSNDTATPGSRSGTLGGGDGTIELDVGNGTIAVRGF